MLNGSSSSSNSFSTDRCVLGLGSINRQLGVLALRDTLTTGSNDFPLVGTVMLSDESTLAGTAIGRRAAANL